MNILVVWPTRDRPLKFQKTFAGWRDSCWHRWDVRFLVSIDSDDESMNSIWESAGGRFNVAVARGRPEGKIAAINRDLEFCPGWDMLVLASDDMIDKGLRKDEGYWHDIVRKDMETYFPDTDGCLWYSDGSVVTDKVCTLVVMGRKYYERFGYIYHPDYKELWCDNEYTEVAKKLDRIEKIDRVLFRHVHPLNNLAPMSEMDETYRKSEAMFHVDKKTFLRRQELNFDLDDIKPPKRSRSRKRKPKRKKPTLDILMCCLQSRIEKAEALRKSIHEQARGKDVRILVEVDDGKLTIGTKRNQLVQRSDADYVCFVDDDDTVADNYVESLLDALRSRPDVVTFNGTILWMGIWKPWEIKLGHGFTEAKGKFLRPPNHLCPVKRSIALNFPFPDKNHGEDTAYASAMAQAKALKKEVHIEKELYFYEPSKNPRKDK